MALELCYTSSPQGLLPGTKGYCTVAASDALTPQMIQALESLSGYRPMFGVGDPEAVNNPTAFSHVRAPVAGVVRSVLSRVAYAGADYSGRINKFAHHLLPGEDETARTSPAWVLSQPDVMRGSWEGSPQRLPQPRSIPAGQVQHATCELWEQATGDAGWAGVLVEQHLLNPAEPIYLVYDPARHDALALTAEAIALLPDHRRWGATFTTYFTDPIAGAECGWRWVIQGSAMADRISAGEIKGRVITLTQPLEPAPDSRYTHAARHGGETQADAEPLDTNIAVAVPVVDPARSFTPPPSAEPLPTSARADTRPAPQPSPAPRAAAVLESAPQPASSPARSSLPKLMAAAVVGAAAVWGGLTLFGAPEGANANRPQPAAGPSVAELESELADSRSYAALLEKEIESLRSRLDTIPSSPVTAAPVAEHQPQVQDRAIHVPVVAVAETPPRQSESSVLLDVEPTTAVALPKETLRPTPSERTYITLRPPTLQTQNAAGLGVLSRLSAQTQPLWASPDPRGSFTLGFQTPAEVPADWLAWVPTPHGASVVRLAHNSLGIARQHVLGEARIENGELVWHWKPEVFHPEDKASSKPLAELYALTRYAVLTVEDRAGRRLAQVQPSEPQHHETVVGQSVVAVPSDALAFPAELSALELPTGWAFISADDDPPVRLHGLGGAEVIIDYTASTGELSSRWSAAAHPTKLADRLEANLAKFENLSEVLAGWEQHEDDYARARAGLPRTGDDDEEMEIDHGKRSQPAWREAFMAYDKSLDARDQYLADHAPEGLDAVRSAHADLNQQIEKDRSLERDIEAFDTARLRLSLTASDADLAFLTITPEVQP